MQTLVSMIKAACFMCRYKNLTDKYYAEKVWHHLQHMFLKEVLIQFLKKPPEEQFLEVGM